MHHPTHFISTLNNNNNGKIPDPEWNTSFQVFSSKLLLSAITRSRSPHMTGARHTRTTMCWYRIKQEKRTHFKHCCTSSLRLSFQISTPVLEYIQVQVVGAQQKQMDFNWNEIIIPRSRITIEYTYIKMNAVWWCGYTNWIAF